MPVVTFARIAQHSIVGVQAPVTVVRTREAGTQRPLDQADDQKNEQQALHLEFLKLPESS